MAANGFGCLSRACGLLTFGGVPRSTYMYLVAAALSAAALAAASAACGTEVPPAGGPADAAPPTADAAPILQGDEARGAVAINEVASGSPGGTPDWIELRRSAGAEGPYDLSGHYLSDAPDRLDHYYRFPAGTVLASGAYLIVFADDGAAGEGHHAPFKLGREDGVYLIDPDGAVVDALLFLGAEDARTLARSPDGAGRFRYAVATPAGANP